MAGRGQSNARMLENMGVDRSEMQAMRSIGNEDRLVPSPLFPPLQFKPLPLQAKTTDYELMLMKLDMDKMRKSRFAVRETNKKTEIERFSDRYRPKPKVADLPAEFHWADFPKELWPVTKTKKRKASSVGMKQPSKRVQIDCETPEQIEQRMQQLETQEKSEGVEAERKSEDEDDENRPDDMELVEEIEEDEELDAGTDYAQDYFDNGEFYGGDEDDGLEEEGVY